MLIVQFSDSDSSVQCAPIGRKFLPPMKPTPKTQVTLNSTDNITIITLAVLPPSNSSTFVLIKGSHKTS